MRLKMKRLPPPPKKCYFQNNDIALSAIHDVLDERTFEQIKNIERAHEAWKKLEELFEGTRAVKGAKAYILKEKFASFKMKEDKSVLEMFHRLQVLVNNLKALGEEVKDKDFSHKFLRCLPLRFWHIGHYSSEEWFGHHNTKLSIGRYDDR